MIHIYSIAVSRHVNRFIGQKVKGKGHMATKTVTVARLLVTRDATAYADVGTHVDSTAYVF